MAAMLLAVVNIGQLVDAGGPGASACGRGTARVGLIPNAALLVEDGRIVAAGAYRGLRSQHSRSTQWSSTRRAGA